MIRATSFDDEVLLHDVAISNDYKKATTQKKSWSVKEEFLRSFRKLSLNHYN